MNVSFDRQTNIPRQVYEVLRGMILCVELQPGESINERRLSAWLKVSRTPIREAIKRLADDGLISITPHVGTAVSRIKAGRIAELFLIRTNLEVMIARTAAERFDRKAERLLRALIDKQQATLAEPNYVQHIAVDNDFHRAVAESAGLTVTWEILRQVMGEITRLRHLSIRVPGRLQQPIDEHLEIVEALKNKSAADAERAMRTHLERSYGSIRVSLDLHPEYFEYSEAEAAERRERVLTSVVG
jgi:GntR family transcriptional regulator, rspAB operon transcriptional repressor